MDQKLISAQFLAISHPQRTFRKLQNSYFE